MYYERSWRWIRLFGSCGRVPAFAGACLALLVIPVYADAAAHLRPDLKVRAVTLSAHSVGARGDLTLHDRTANDGPVSVEPSVTGYYLAKSSRHRRGDLRLGGRRVRELASGAVSSGSRKVRVPAGTAAGSYRIFACADDLGNMREDDESNNCRIATAALTVTAVVGSTGPDTTPATFAGLEAATVTSPTVVRLSWRPAADNRTPVSQLVYDVYMATAADAENYGSPTASSALGATSIDITGLSALTTYYFVVLARDQAGNHSASRVERSVTIPDTAPPVFGGIVRAVEGGVCCNGPVLTWDGASDNVTPANEIVYDIYTAATPGQEDLLTPTFTTAPGATSYQVSLGSPAGPYWIVRARDTTGNRDSNTHEVETLFAP